MEDSLFILGRQPALGRAELESLCGPDQVKPFGSQAVIVAAAQDKPQLWFNRLGGAMKQAKIIAELDQPQFAGAEKYLLVNIAKLISGAPSDAKIQLGLSVYGLPVSSQKITATGLSLKKAIKKSGRSVRLIPNQTPELNSAQVLHNHLVSDKGFEFIIMSDGKRIVIAQTTAVQDIDGYTHRDRDRPKRDARVGMLPPKLAQIIINLAAAQTNPLHGHQVLDPFCGTGVIPIEATMMGFDIIGSDLDQRMVDYSDTNLLWLLDQPNCPVSRPPEHATDPNWRYYQLETADATNHQWPLTKHAVIACETYLGRPLTSLPNPQNLATNIADCNQIIKKFLQNVAAQTKPGFRLCIAIPAWQIHRNEFKHLPLVDSLAALGYNRIRFEHVRDEQLLYYREDQLVGRELLVLTRN